MTTGDDAERGGPASEPVDGLPFLPPARSTPWAPSSVPTDDETPPATPPDLPAHTPSDPPEGAPALPPRPAGEPVAARLGPPPNAPLASSDLGTPADTSEPSGPDPEVIAALQANAARLRRRNRAFRVALALVVILGMAAAAFFGYRAYDREQDDRQPPTTERPTSEELLDRLDGDD